MSRLEFLISNVRSEWIIFKKCCSHVLFTREKILFLSLLDRTLVWYDSLTTFSLSRPFLVLLDRDFVLNWHVSDDKKSTRPFCRVSGTEGGEEDTGCTHQTPSLATLFNPLTPLLLPLYLPIVLYACVITKGKWAVQYTTALYRSRIFFFFDSYIFPFSLRRSF